MKKKFLVTSFMLALILMSAFILGLAVDAEKYGYELLPEDNEEYGNTEIIVVPEEMEARYPVHGEKNIPEHIPGSIRLLECPHEFFVGRETLPEKRVIYYVIDGFITDLVSHEELLEFQSTVLASAESLNTMSLVLFIQHFNISRDEMESAVMRMYEARSGLIQAVTDMMQKEQAKIIMEIHHTEVTVDSNVLKMYNLYMELKMNHSEATLNSNRQIDRNLLGWPWYSPYADPMHEINELPNLDIIFTFDNDIINWYYRRR